MIINTYKPVGVTSFEIIRQVKKRYPGQKVGYVGTLDPMADGVLLVLTGDDTKKCQELVDLPKEYEFTVVFGIATDSGDILGLVKPEIPSTIEITAKSLKATTAKFVGKYRQTVPAFSSVKYKGKELYKLAHRNLAPAGLPVKEVAIYKIELLKFKTLPYSELEKEIFERLKKLGTNVKQFRGEQVITAWQDYFKGYKGDRGDRDAKIATIRATVSRGTYIRSLAEDIGKKLGTSAMCLSITRTKVGDWSSIRDYP
ncbi:hypothetical protein KJ664_00250 [Patescibacteria group bacterium]|nr:hypothetical protein [Patescibacteria group bacterium]